MSNSLIPYSFTPGAKAKAQEVNANFIALAEKIEENREYTTGQIAETVEKIEQSTAESENKKADKNLGNTPLIANCVLDAPNGVIEVSENVITVKKGLKVLIPDGFNLDGTPKNIEYELSEDVQVQTVKNSFLNCVYVTPTGCNYAQAYVQSEQTPYTKRGLWYKLSENMMYLYNADSNAWEKINAVVLVLYENTADTAVIYQTVKPYSLLTSFDKQSIINWLMPCYGKWVQKAWDTKHIAMKNGYMYMFTVTNDDKWTNFDINGVNHMMNWCNYGNISASCILMPLKRGDEYRAYGNSNSSYLYFLPMEGDY